MGLHSMARRYAAYGKPGLAPHTKLLGLVAAEETAPRPAKVVAFFHVDESTPQNAFASLGVELNDGEGSLRTGIAVFALPLSVFSVLVATSKYYQPAHVLEFLLPLLGLNVALIALGSYLVIHSILRIRHYDRMIKELKRKHSAIAEFMD